MASYPALELRFAPGPGAGALQDQLYGELDAFEPLAIHEHDTGDGWLVFFRHASQRDAARHALASTFGRNVLDVRPVDVEDDDWARRSQASLTAIRIGRIVVAPPWDAPTFKSQAPGPNDHGSNPASGAEDSTLLIVIEPSTGFGTGHHATTRLCLALLQEMELVGRTVIDIGTGSGVLAIAARLLGAAAVTAVDNDPDALANARENIARNPDAGAIGVMEAELAFLSAPPADVVTANLTGAVLRKYASTLTALVRPGGTLIASGFGERELPEVVAALGRQADRELREEDWCAVVIRRAPAAED